MSDWFSNFTRTIERLTGSPWSFVVAVLTVVVWACFGPVFHYSDTWQLVINTSTTIVTFWLVFIIQSTQTRDTAALHLKLDELIRVNRQARNELVDIEDRTKEEIDFEKEAISRLTKN